MRCGVYGAAITWQVYGAKANEFKLVDDAKVCRVRAEQDDAKAQAKLGDMYSHGQGVPKDYAEAVRWYRKAADQGRAVMTRQANSRFLDYADRFTIRFARNDRVSRRSVHDRGGPLLYSLVK